MPTKEYLRKWREEHPNSNKNYQKKWFANPENREKKQIYCLKPSVKEAHKEYNKKYVLVSYKDKKSIQLKKWRLENPDKVKSQRLAQKIPLNKNCDICHSTNNLQRHHWRYDKPLLVNTLCEDCHSIQHVKHFDESIFGNQQLVIQ